MFKMSAVGSLSVRPRGRTHNAFSRRAGHASISTLDVRTGRLQWGTAVHWRGYHKIEYTLEASLRQVRPRRLGGCHKCFCRRREWQIIWLLGREFTEPIKRAWCPVDFAHRFQQQILQSRVKILSHEQAVAGGK